MLSISPYLCKQSIDIMQLPYDSGLVRLVIRIYLAYITLPLVTLIGQKCYVLHNKLTLLNHHRISVTTLSGWLRGLDLLLIPLRIRRLPIFSFFCLMIIGSILAHLADLAMTVVVKTIYIHEECDFTAGLVLSATNVWKDPPGDCAPAHVVSQAIQTSLNNGGCDGIYAKANSDPLFQASYSSDRIGGWECIDVLADQTFAAGLSVDEVGQQLYSLSLGYDEWQRDYTVLSDGTFNQLVVWSSSVSDDTQEPFAVKASFQTDLRVLTMKSYNCSLTGSLPLEIASSISSRSTLDSWKSGLLGTMYYGANTPLQTNAIGRLAWYLDSMIMVAGGGNNLLSLPPVSAPTQGCRLQGTNLPLSIIVLTAGCTLLLTVVVVSYMVLWILLRQHKQRYMVQDLPDSIVGWMSQASSEAKGGMERVRSAELNEWDLVATVHGLRVEKTVEESSQRMLWRT